MNRKERIRRAGELRVQAELLMLELRKDAATWRQAWRARERWMKRYDEEVEGWYLNLQDQVDVEELVRYTARSWSVPFALRKEATPPPTQTILERIHAELASTTWSQQSVASYIALALRTGEDAGQFSLDALGINRTFAWAHPRAMGRDLYAIRGSKIIQGTYGAHLEKLADIVIRATNPTSPATIGQVVKEIRGEWSSLARWQAERIARTEVAAVWEHTSYNTMRANGISQFDVLVASGPSIGVVTGAVDSICLDIAASGPYSSENEVLPPFHPNCRCTLLPVLEGPGGEPWLPPQEPFTGGVLDGWSELE